MAFGLARSYILLGDAWYAVSTIGERVLGYGLIDHFDEALALLQEWVPEPSPWLRRAVGVAVHFFAKRVRDDPARIQRLLALLTPLIEERDTSALKGVGWGLKTIGRYYPDELVPFLQEELAGRHPRKLLLRKATTYLDDAHRSKLLAR